MHTFPQVMWKVPHLSSVKKRNPYLKFQQLPLLLHSDTKGLWTHYLSKDKSHLYTSLSSTQTATAPIDGRRGKGGRKNRVRGRALYPDSGDKRGLKPRTDNVHERV